MIRRATDVDAQALTRVLGDWVRETGWMPVLHSRDEDMGFLRHQIACAEVWCVDGAGFIARQGEEVPALYLAPDARGQGLGAALLTRAKQGRTRLQLWTFQKNVGALRFYARKGFAEIDRTNGAENDEKLPDVRLEWRAA